MEHLLADEELEDDSPGGTTTLELDSLRLSTSFILQPVVDGNNSNKPTTVRNSLNNFNVLHSFLLASYHLTRDLQRAAFPPLPSSDQTEEEDVRKHLLFLILPSHNLPGGLEGP
jgi:hypothetical protein